MRLKTKKAWFDVDRSLIGDDVAHGLPIEEHGLHGASGLVVERLLYELSSTEMEL